MATNIQPGTAVFSSVKYTKPKAPGEEGAQEVQALAAQEVRPMSS